MMRSSVVLPQPEAPSSTMNSWSAMVRSIECSAVKAPKLFFDALDLRSRP